MSRYGTYIIVIAIVLMLTPDILEVFGVSDVMSEPIYPIITLCLGGLGVIIHFINLIQKKEFSWSAGALLLSVAMIIAGVSLSALNIQYTQYITLAGLLLVALWIAVPQRKHNKKADQE